MASVPAAQRHPRDIIRDALAAQQQQPDNAIPSSHVAFIFLSLVAAMCILGYEAHVMMTKKGITIKNDKKASVRYLNDIADVHALNYYDYIIVGAGTAGSVLATRLAVDESTHSRILLIDSKSIDSMVQDPERRVTTFEPIDLEDRIQIESSNHHKTWTSSSSKVHQHNIWSIGHRADYDESWNLSTFKWKDIGPYFKKSEKMMIPEIIEQFGVRADSESRRPRSRKSSRGLLQRIFGRRQTEEELFDYGPMDISHRRGL